MTKSGSIDTHIAALADVAPGEFVRARNELAAELKKSNAAVARAVRKLVKPSPVAWALNQVARHHEHEMGEYLDFADALERVQTGKARADLGEVIRAERAARQAIVKLASDALRVAKVGLTPERRRRIADTLLASATGATRKELEHGKLTGELEPTGLPNVELARALHIVPVRREEPTRAPSRPTGRLKLVKRDDNGIRERDRELERKRVAREHAREETARRKQQRRAAEEAQRAAHAEAVTDAERALEAAEAELRVASAAVKARRDALSALKKNRPRSARSR